MNAHQILRSDLLDIIFEGRNKEYGAYELRRTYNRRIVYALFGMLGIILLIFAGRAIAGKFTSKPTDMEFIIKANVLQVLPVDEPEPLPPPPVKELPPPVTASVQYTKPDIVDDNKVITPPVDMTEIENARIDLKSQEGDIDMGIVVPPSVEKGTQVIAGPPEKKPEDKPPFTRVEKEAQFPGGSAAWLKYVTRAIQSKLDEFSDADYGTCQVKFVVSNTGEVSDVQAITMKGSKLAEIAVNAIRKGPRWIPALQNGRYVNAYRVQPVTLQNPNY